jgi:DNA anti-recombination protein RmuC
LNKSTQRSAKQVVKKIKDNLEKATLGDIEGLQQLKSDMEQEARDKLEIYAKKQEEKGNKIKEDELTENVEEVVEEMTEAVEETAENVTETTEEVTENVTETVEETVENVTEATEEVAETVTETVEEVANTETEVVEEVVAGEEETKPEVTEEPTKEEEKK